MKGPIALIILMFVINSSTAAKFYLYGGDKTYVQVTDEMTHTNAAEYCRENLKGQLAMITSQEELKKMNQVVAQGFASNGFFQSRDWTEMYVGGYVDTNTNDLVDPKDVNSAGSNVVILSSWHNPEDCDEIFCLFSKPVNDPVRRFLCETEHVKFSMAMVDYTP